MFEIKKYSSELRLDWNDFNNSAKNGLFFFHRDFLEYHADRFEDHSLLIYKKNKLTAIFPATQNKNEISSHGGLTFGSLIMSFELKAPEVLSIFREIKNYYSDQSFTKIFYKSIPSIFNQYPSDEDAYALFREEAKLVRRDLSSVINLRNPIKFSETKRQLVKKCSAQNIIVTEEPDLGEFWTILTQVLEKFETAPTHSLHEITYLKGKFTDQIKLFTAKKDNAILAGILIFDFGNVVHTQYMAATEDGRKMGALDYINSILIKKYEARSYYSFGISTENQGKILNEGLVQQKENMGARGVVLDQYEITL